MSAGACAGLVERGDPDRFLAAMSGSRAAREALFPLYAFNLEIARAAYAAREPMVALMRLQFWADTVAAAARGDDVAGHEVAGPLAGVIGARDLPEAPFLAMIEARMAEASGEGMPGPTPVVDFVEATAGSLMVLSGRALGAGTAADPGLSALGFGSGLANWLMAIPALRAAGRGFVQPEVDEIAELARNGQEALAKARRDPALADPALLPALRAGWRAGRVLRLAAHDPQAALSGRLGGSEFTRRGGLLLRVLSGRW